MYDGTEAADVPLAIVGGNTARFGYSRGADFTRFWWTVVSPGCNWLREFGARLDSMERVWPDCTHVIVVLHGQCCHINGSLCRSIGGITAVSIGPCAKRYRLECV